MRLDKYLSNAKIGSRKEVGKWIRKGLVTVNGGVEKIQKLMSLTMMKSTLKMIWLSLKSLSIS